MNLDPSGFEQTVDIQPSQAQSSQSASPAATRAASIDGSASKKSLRVMKFIQGSTPALSSQTNDLLRRRVRSAALLMFAGFLAFFVRSLFYLDRIESTFDWVLLANHGLVTAITGMVGLRLCANCPFVANHLRIFELVIFGDSALYFLMLSYWLLTQSAPEGYLIPITPVWLMLIFVYALFIPNTLRRAAMVIGGMAAAPVILCAVLCFASPAYCKVVETNDHFHGFTLQTAMVMTLAAVASVWGAHTMGSLRREAFEAKQLGQYRLKKKLGEGGMGEVHLAEHVLLKRPCAIKLIRPEKAGDSQALARFEREVRATAKLTHWNTVEIYDYGRAEDGTFYYVMEYLPGMNLGQLVEGYGPLPAGRAIHLLAQTCEALSEAHNRDLIHRDIKPANIFAAHRGDVFDVAKLLDFGLAKPLADTPGPDVTMEGSITGSPMYMSPEQVLGNRPPDARSDIYSLGVVAYYLVTGAPPFQSERAMEIMMAHARDAPPLPCSINPDVPDDLQQIIVRCLEKDPEHRFQSAEQLRQALLECEATGSWTRESAWCWWQDYGCPKKKALDRAVLQEVTV